MPSQKQWERSERIPEKCTADITQKNTGRAPIMREETDRCSENDNTKPYYLRNSEDRCDNSPSDRGDDRLDTGDTVDPVHEIVGIDDPHDPEQCCNNTDNAKFNGWPVWQTDRSKIAIGDHN